MKRLIMLAVASIAALLLSSCGEAEKKAENKAATEMNQPKQDVKTEAAPAAANVEAAPADANKPVEENKPAQ